MEKLLNEIVQSLTDETTLLFNCLLKAKVLAYKIDNQNLKYWINCELNGYGNDDELPEYRKYFGTVIGTMSNGHYLVSNATIPLMHLKEKASNLECFFLLDDIGSIEKMLIKTRGDVLTKRLPPEFCLIINDGIKANGYFVVDAGVQINKNVLYSVLNSVKSKLLDFLLELENQFDYKINYLEVKKKNEKVNQIISNTIYGNNNVVLAGDKNIQNVNINISKGDFNELSKVLKQSGVEDVDIEELKVIVEEDTPDYEHRKFGINTKNWIKKMTAKAIDGTWKISLTAAGHILGTALEHYFGLNK
jgi:hypothetical protein